MEKRRLQRVCTSGPHGDACCNYDIITDREYTVAELIQEILNEHPEEWGDFEIYANKKWLFDKGGSSLGDFTAKYKKGGALENELPENLEKKRVKEVKSNGGWSLMTYYIKAE